MDVLAGRTSSTSPSVADGGLLREQAEYWRETLAHAPEPLEVPADRPRPAQLDSAAALVPLELDEELAAALNALGMRHRSHISTVLLAGWAAVLGRLSGQADLVIGCFANALPVRMDLSGSPTAAELVGRVEARVQGALRNQDLPFAAPSATPLFRAGFAWRDEAGSGLQIDGAEPRSMAGLDLSLDLWEEGSGIAGQVVFATALFDRATVERYAGYLRRVLAGMAADETRPVDRLALLADEERRLVVEEWNRTETPYPADSYIHERFEAQARRTPDAVAVVFEDRRLTYGQLNARANRLAHHLRSMGVGPDLRVGICVEREPELVVAVLGVLKSGGAYLPLDPAYPRERLLDMVQDSAPVVMLTKDSLAGRLAGLDVPLLPLDEDAAWWATQPASDPERAALTPEHLTYVIYTSGSTGRPKGVMMTHGGASNLLHWYLGATALTERDAVLVVTSFSFHLTQRNLMAPLFVGGRVHLAREPFEPGRITAQIVASGITMMNLTPTGFQALVEADGGRAIGGLRIVVFGGEPLYPRQLARVPEPRPVFLNPYGSTEATGITAHHYARADLSSYSSRSMPPGRPIANATIYVLDQAGEPVPVGVTGELYLGGAGVTRGYRRLPGQTAERYLPDPFGGTPGARLYRTGDLGRWLPDGTIEFMGRGDAQVKVRGFRIELGEIEARLAEHAAVHEAVVVARAREGEAGDPRLVAYYTGDSVGAAALRALLAERLPDYMVPAAFVHMDALPVNPNGKLDRKALPEPVFAGDEEAYVAPRTPVEEVLAGIWAEVLGVARLGVEASFFELGGHSLLATRVVSQVRERFGVELPLRALFEGPTVAELAARVEEMRGAGLPVLPPVVPAGRTRTLPLSFTQQRLWFLEQLGTPGSVYHLHKSLRLRGALNVDALARALDGVVARHEALRTTFAQVDGVPEQRIAPAAASGFRLVEHDLGGRSDAEAELDRLIAAEARAPFDLERGPLVRGRLVRLGADDHVLLLAMHHLVTDGWSFGVLFDELSALYAAHAQGREARLPDLPVQYADYAVWQRRWVEGDVLREQADYWTRTLAGAPALLELPTDRPRPAQVDHAGAVLGVELDEALTAGLKALARRHGTTPYMTLVAGWAVVLSRLSGQDDVVIGTPTAGRGRPETEGLIGCFVNTLALRLELSGAPTVAELLGRVKERALAAQHHQDIPFEQVVELVDPVRSVSYHPLFQVVIAWQNMARGEGNALSLPGVEAGVAEESAHVDAKTDLWLGLWEADDRILGRVKYSTALFDRATVERHLGYLRRVLEAFAADDLQAVDTLPLLPGAERRLVLQAWNRTEAAYPRGACIHELFQAQVRNTPDAVALVSGDISLTYAELNARANRLARRLAALGAAPETIVALALERSVEMVVALLAVTKTGAAFLSIDPDYPAERRRWMLDRSAARLVLTTSALAADLPETGAAVVALDRIAAEVAGEDGGDLSVRVDAENAAYVIFTSGSTGRPKGVVVPHRGIGNLAAAQREAFGVQPGGRVLQFASFSFDAAVAEVAHTLLGGATLVMARPGQAGPELLALLRDSAVTVATLPPSLLATLPAEGLPALRTVVSAGEAVSADVVARWGEGRRFVNAYGPTETTVCATVSIDPSPRGRPPIGSPIANVRTYVLDARMQPVPVGVPGELYVGGVGVARGYLGQPAQTAGRFVPDAFGGEPGARLYRTGDLVRWRPDGSIEFLGRTDFQVKIRGFRIEPGEIEARLVEHAGVREAVVLVREDTPGEKRLVAYWTGEAGADVEALRAHLGGRLPEHMVPAAYVHLEMLPLTPNGKLDRKALPSPDGEAFVRHGHEAPVGAVEQALAEIWSEVLGVDRVGRHDDFFELGGHSLLALQMASHVQQVLDVEVEPGKVFECPVLKDLAEVLAAAGRVELQPIERVDRGGHLPLSFAQQRLWFLEQMGGLGSAYHASQRLRLRGALDRGALGRALDGVVARHEALRTTFAEVDGTAEQRIAPAEAGFHLVELDLAGRPEAELERVMAEERRAPFDLRRGPLVRGRLVRLADDDHVLLLTMHHIVTDGWSMGVLFEELSALYAAQREGREARLAALPVQYADYAAWQRRWLEGDVLREQAEYWTRTLAGAPRLLELPTDRPRPAEMDHAGAVLPLELDAELTAGLNALSRRHGATLYMTLLAGWAAVLGRLSGQDDVVVGTPTAGRGRWEIEGLIGFFVNTLAVRVDLSGAPTVAQLLERVKERSLEAQGHQDIPFEQVVELVQPARSMSYSPLFQALFALQNAPMGEAPSLPGLEVGAVGAGGSMQEAKFDLSLSLREADDRIAGNVTYATALFERDTVERWMGYLRRVLAEMVADDARGVERLALMPESERALVVEAWNRTDEPFTDLVLIHRHFEAQVARAPGATAVEFGGESLTYAELDARANRLAHRLVELGVRPEGRVALCMEPCSGAIAGLLGVMKAGAAYVPLDPAAPDERTAFMLAESGARIVLADAASAARPWAAGYEVLVVGGELDAELERHPATPPAVQVGPRHLAYVLYTSGSTGVPKGVLVEHGGVCNTIATFSRLYENGPESRVLLFAPLHFDASVLDVFTALANGGTLIVAPRHETIPGDELTGLLARKRITHAKFTPSALAATPWAHLPELQVVILGGEICSAELVARWAPGRRFFNGWGPTEVSVRSTAFQATDGTCPPPIGRPLGNVTHYVLDPAGRPVPVGVPGEIYVGGAGVTRGYLGRPALTAERYVPDPFARHPGARMYRTGDKVRWRADGMLDFVARMDGQVKVRGFRIELGEIEAVLRRHERVADCVVMVREDVPGDQRLVAYVVGGAGTDELREHVRQTLPEYMVPAAFVFLDAFPLSPNGKLDRKALPAPEYGAAEETYVSPRTPTEEVLAGIWAEVLGVERVGADDQFFELGGHSLVATRVAARVRGVFGVDLPLRAVFEHSVLSELAAEIERLRGTGASAGEGAIAPAPREGDLPVTFAQERLWFVDALDPGSPVYAIPFSYRTTGRLDPHALRRALAKLVRRHEPLRTTLPAVDGVPVQRIGPPPSSFDLPVADLRHLPEEERRAEARRLEAEARRHRFDLARGPLFRASLVRVADAEHHLLLNIHHAIGDGWSLGVLREELSALYGAFARGEPSPLPEPALQYADYAVWQRERLSGAVLERQVEFWRRALDGAPALLELPTDRPRPPVESHRGALERLVVSSDLTAEVHALARREGATLFMVLLAALDVVLGRLAGQKDVVVGTPIAGRTRAETDRMVGLFLNSLALRTDLSGDPSFRELLGRVRETTLSAYAHQELPFERVLEEVRPERSMAHAPVFQVMLNLANFQRGAFQADDLEVAEASPGDDAASKFDLTLYVKERDGGLHVNLVYAADLFDAPRMRGLLSQVEGVLRQAVAAPETRVGALSLATEAARGVLPDPARPIEAEACRGAVHEVVAARAMATPHALAVEDPRERWTYAELDAAANRIAHRLIDCGVKPGNVVAVYAHRSAALVRAMLGTWKAGAAFAILDPAYPPARLAAQVRASKPLVILLVTAAGDVPSDLIEALGESVKGAIVLGPKSDDPDSIARFPATAPAVSVGPDDLAYVAFTSGTTGTPKAIAGTHRPLAHFFGWYAKEFGIGEADRVSLLSGLAHDPLLRDVFAPLAVGGSIAIPDAGEIGTPGWLAGWMRDFGVTVAHLTPAMAQVLATGPADAQLPALRLACFGGDVLRAADVERLRAVAPNAEAVNFYGATETPQAMAFFRIPADLSAVGPAVPMGRGIEGVDLLVITPSGALAGIGERGEIAVRTPYLSRGYLNDAELTASRFVPNPLTGDPADRVYRTGDLGRYRADGAVEPAGRVDGQVKVRGFRVELGEIEAALAKHPSVREAVVAARGEGDRALVAYAVPREGAGMDVEALRAHLKSLLPDYMVPAAFMAIAAVPLTANGKVDRRALPEPEASASGQVAPRTPTEEILAQLWAEVLRLDSVGVNDDFFALGGHSLLATRLLARVQNAMSVVVPLRALFEGPTVAELAVRVEEMRRAGLPVLPPVVPVDRDRPLPLSFAQERLWFIDQLEGGSAPYNIPAALRLTGALDVDALERSLGEIVRRHESLRTIFREVDEGAVQVIAPFAGFALPVDDLSLLPEAEREAEVRRRVREDAARPFDLTAGPLVRAVLLPVADEEHVLLLCIHHIVSDGWSSGVLRRELSALYAAYREGGDSPLAALPVQYADFAVWQREQLRGEVLDAQVGYWKERLAGAPALLELPTDRPRPAVQSHRGARERFDLPRTLLDRLQALGRGEGATLYMVMLSAFQLLLSKYSGSDDVVVGSPIAGRTRREVEELIGFFANTLVLRTDLSADPTFRELLGRVREGTLGAYEHQDVPFERLVAELQPERSLSHSPLFQVMFALQNADRSGFDVAGLRMEGVSGEVETTRFDLGLTAIPHDGGIRGALEYSTDLFDRSTVQRMLGHLERVLEQVAEDADVRLSRLELLSAEERGLVVDAWNRTERETSDPPAHVLFAEWARRAPEAVALLDGREAVTYGALDRRAAVLAGHLRSLGVGPETPVGLCMERTPELLVGVLGIWKAGGAYVPLDPGYPAERLGWIIADAALPVVVATAGTAGVLPEHGATVVRVDELVETEAAPEVPASDASLAYVIYTSGSTGRPKGVLVEHGSLANLLAATREAFGIREGDVMPALASYAFDIWLFEALLPLTSGATVRLVDRERVMDVPALVEEIADATLVHAVPALMRQLVHAERETPRLGRLRRAFVGGDRVAADLLAEMREALPAAESHVFYGPTEGTILASTHPVPQDGMVYGHPIGRPLGNVRLYVCDALGGPQPAGIPGELLIGGAGVARGYLRRPAMTAERFVPDPFSADPGARLYRTGDRARWRADGTLEFLGRTDFQVKIRGFRIEPGEIEAVLREHEGVRECAVLVREDAGESRLVAYVAGGVEADALREHLRRSLPEYMVPAAFVVLDALPLTPNGKLDRHALPAPDYAAGADRYVAPRTPAEEALAEIWAEVLGLDRVGVQESFFDLGGHSLLATRVVSRVRKRFGVELPLRALFEHRTVEELARVVAESEAVAQAGPVPEPAPGPEASAHHLLATIDELSEEELDRLLSAQL
ncbi:MAG TPA: non-ribosomal peptide synthase/polyketide synthase [Longimicrobium sp.]|jgi:amino acid adenylation domain-containing protein|uniref:non-ribosomal peptide synthetase n=1 Tax=Longimicrobium sp. TaxID=2029185 RepID=UPI002ED8FFE5